MIQLPVFGSATRQLAGLDISSSSVKLVELSAGDKEAYKVERYAIEPLPRDAVSDGNIANLEAVSEAILRALRRFDAGPEVHARAALAINTQQVVLAAERWVGAPPRHGGKRSRHDVAARTLRRMAELDQLDNHLLYFR